MSWQTLTAVGGYLAADVGVYVTMVPLVYRWQLEAHTDKRCPSYCACRDYATDRAKLRRTVSRRRTNGWSIVGSTLWPLTLCVTLGVLLGCALGSGLWYGLIRPVKRLAWERVERTEIAEETRRRFDDEIAKPGKTIELRGHTD